MKEIKLSDCLIDWNISSTYQAFSLQIIVELHETFLNLIVKSPRLCHSFFLSFCHSSKIFLTPLYNSVRRTSARRNASMPKSFFEHAHRSIHTIFGPPMNPLHYGPPYEKDYEQTWAELVQSSEQNRIYGLGSLRLCLLVEQLGSPPILPGNLKLVWL